jgi:hypothetical protein
MRLALGLLALALAAATARAQDKHLFGEKRYSGPGASVPLLAPPKV